jgi:hypothetical protein
MKHHTVQQTKVGTDHQWKLSSGYFSTGITLNMDRILNSLNMKVGLLFKGFIFTIVCIE